MAALLKIKDKSACRYDLVALGEVMLRLDPGEGRIHTARALHAWEGGGEYNVARGLKRCFGTDTAIVTALVDNPVGRLVQDLISWTRATCAGRPTTASAARRATAPELHRARLRRARGAGLLSHSAAGLRIPPGARRRPW